MRRRRSTSLTVAACACVAAGCFYTYQPWIPYAGVPASRRPPAGRQEDDAAYDARLAALNKSLALQRLARDLQSSDGRVSARAADRLARRGAAGENVLVEGMWRGTAAARATAARTLARLAPLEDETIAALARAGARPELVPALVAALESPADGVFADAAVALARLGPAASPAVEALVRTLEARPRRARIMAAAALGKIAPGEPLAIGALERLLGDGDFDVRRSAAEALARGGAPALPSLARAQASDDPHVRWAVCHALGRGRGAWPDARQADEMLAALADDPDPFVRRAAARARAPAK